MPPKYTTADFRKQSYWSARGKLDVPKERFILYPDAGRETDPTPLLGWAGWDHAQQSLALATIIQQRQAEGAPDATLVPLVAGMAELQPWVEQWHAAIDPPFGVSPAAFCGEQLRAHSQALGVTRDDLARWRPAPTTRGRKARSMSALLRDIFTIPERTSTADYVLRLTESVDEAHLARTLDDYVVTDEMARAFDTALGRGRRGDRHEHQQGRVPDRLVRFGQEPLHGGAVRAAAPAPEGAGDPRPRRARSPGTTRSCRAAGSCR